LSAIETSRLSNIPHHSILAQSPAAQQQSMRQLIERMREWRVHLLACCGLERFLSRRNRF
jgi:hypothetical protein